MKLVVITGASRGIGLGLTREYLSAGQTVIATHRPGSVGPELAALQAQHPSLTLAPLDLALDLSIQQFGQLLAGKRIDLLINNAGTANHIDYGHWTRHHFLDSYTVNAAGPALLIQALDTRFNPGAKIVQLSSGLASLSENINPTGPFEEYAMSKVALNMLTRRLAVKLAGRNITLAAISPGWVQTDMGGPQAPTSVAEVSRQLAGSIASLSMAHSGKFFDAELNPIDW